MIAVNTLPASFVLADYFDVVSHHRVPDYVYDQENGLACSCDNGKVEAINQFHEDVLITCPHCNGGGYTLAPSKWQSERHRQLTGHTMMSLASCSFDHSHPLQAA